MDTKKKWITNELPKSKGWNGSMYVVVEKSEAKKSNHTAIVLCLRVFVKVKISYERGDMCYFAYIRAKVLLFLLGCHISKET